MLFGFSCPNMNIAKKLGLNLVISKLIILNIVLERLKRILSHSVLARVEAVLYVFNYCDKNTPLHVWYFLCIKFKIFKNYGQFLDSCEKAQISC